MSVAREYVPVAETSPKPDPIAAYLEAERRAAVKSEYFHGDIVMMAGGSPAHSLIAANLAGELYAALQGSSCRVYNSDLKVRSAPTQYVYPDLTVICGDLEADDIDPDTATNPRLIVEVLSPSTEYRDRFVKWLRYQTMTSLTDYVLISQDQPVIEHFQRNPGGPWQYASVLGLEADLVIASPNCRLPLRAIYDGVPVAADPLL